MRGLSTAVVLLAAAIGAGTGCATNPYQPGAAATVGSISEAAGTIATATADFMRERMGDLLGRTGLRRGRRPAPFAGGAAAPRRFVLSRSHTLEFGGANTGRAC